MRKLAEHFLTYFPGEKISYIVINLLISSLSFVKSFIFMKYLDLYDLGILTIIQTVIMSIGLLQMGFLNGGYRIFAIGQESELRKINNQIFSFIAVLSAFLLLVFLALLSVDIRFSYYMLLAGIMTGLLSLAGNWLINALIATHGLSYLNRFNLISTILSLLAIPLIFSIGIYGAIAVLFFQPLSFIMLCLVFRKDLRPSRFILDKKLIRTILSFGFIPFLTGIFTLLTNQVERWSILGWLGTINLGKFYIVFLFSSLYVLIPGSLNNLFFPGTIRSYRDGDYHQIGKSVKRYYIILGVYILLAAALTIFILDEVIAWVLPVHLENVRYVYYILPGLIMISLTDPLGLLYNASAILKPMFWAYFTSVLLYLVLIGMYIILDNLSLTSVAFLRSVTGIYIFIFFAFSYLRFRKLIWQTK